MVQTSGTLNPYADLRRPNGTIVCPATTSDEFGCTLDTTGTHTLVVRGVSGTGAGSFSTTIQNLQAPVGCATVPFGETGTTATIAQAAELDCFTRAGGQVGQRWRLRMVETAGSLAAGMDLIRPDGTTLCGITYSIEITCTLDASGTHRVLVRDASGTLTGDYRLVVQRFPTPVGCAAVTVGGAAATDAMDVPGDMDCFTFSGVASSTVRVRVTKTSGTWTPYTEVLRPDGTTVCGPTTSGDFNCTIDVAGSRTILVRDVSGPGVGNYTVELDPA